MGIPFVCFLAVSVNSTDGKKEAVEENAVCLQGILGRVRGKSRPVDTITGRRKIGYAGLVAFFPEGELRPETPGLEVYRGPQRISPDQIELFDIIGVRRGAVYRRIAD